MESCVKDDALSFQVHDSAIHHDLVSKQKANLMCQKAGAMCQRVLSRAIGGNLARGVSANPHFYRISHSPVTTAQLHYYFLLQ
jgi:hypothetical protein